jgi:hypothetical protein
MKKRIIIPSVFIALVLAACSPSTSPELPALSSSEIASLSSGASSDSQSSSVSGSSSSVNSSNSTNPSSSSPQSSSSSEQPGLPSSSSYGLPNDTAYAYIPPAKSAQPTMPFTRSEIAARASSRQVQPSVDTVYVFGIGSIKDSVYIYSKSTDQFESIQYYSNDQVIQLDILDSNNSAVVEKRQIFENNVLKAINAYSNGSLIVTQLYQQDANNNSIVDTLIAYNSLGFRTVMTIYNSNGIKTNQFEYKDNGYSLKGKNSYNTVGQLETQESWFEDVEQVEYYSELIYDISAPNNHRVTYQKRFNSDGTIKSESKFYDNGNLKQQIQYDYVNKKITTIDIDLAGKQIQSSSDM